MKMFSRSRDRGRWVHDSSRGHGTHAAPVFSTPGTAAPEGTDIEDTLRVVEPPASLVRKVRQGAVVVVVVVALAASWATGRAGDPAPVVEDATAVAEPAPAQQQWDTALGVPDALTVVAGMYTRGGLCAGPNGTGVVCESLFVVYADGHAETLSRSAQVSSEDLGSLIAAYEASSIPAAAPGGTPALCQGEADGTDVLFLTGPGRLPAGLRTGAPSIGSDTAQVISACDHDIDPSDPLLAALAMVRAQTLT